MLLDIRQLTGSNFGVSYRRHYYYCVGLLLSGGHRNSKSAKAGRPVESSAASLLRTVMFDELKASPKIGRSEALRRSMMELASREDRPDHAHPVFCEPYLVVG